MTIERLKWAAVISFIVSLGGLLIGGMFANRETPPYPSRVMGPDGTTLFTKSDIIAGQDVYQRYGLMDHGSVWGHGSQRGMEFSVVTLHLMGETVQAHVARDSFGRPLAELTGEDRDVVDIRTRRDLKTNRFDATTNVLTLSDGQVEALGKAASSFWNFLVPASSDSSLISPWSTTSNMERISRSTMVTVRCSVCTARYRFRCCCSPGVVWCSVTSGMIVCWPCRSGVLTEGCWR